VFHIFNPAGIALTAFSDKCNMTPLLQIRFVFSFESQILIFVWSCRQKVTNISEKSWVRIQKKVNSYPSTSINEREMRMIKSYVSGGFGGGHWGRFPSSSQKIFRSFPAKTNEKWIYIISNGPLKVVFADHNPSLRKKCPPLPKS
jgi:hypothetical protein